MATARKLQGRPNGLVNAILIALCFCCNFHELLATTPDGAVTKPPGCRLFESESQLLEGYDMEGSCPVSSRQSKALKVEDILLHCGEMETCGETYAIIWHPGGYKFLVKTEGIRLVEPDWEASDLPSMFPSIVRPFSGKPGYIAYVKEKPTSFFVLKRQKSRGSRILMVDELAPGTQVFIHERFGNDFFKGFIGKKVWKEGLIL